MGGVIFSSWGYVFSAVNEGQTIYYNISSGNAEVTFETSSYNSYSGDIVIPATVINDDIQYNVTSIGSYAFKGCTGLTSVTIPSSITSLYSNAFDGCSGLTTINYNAINITTSYWSGPFTAAKSSITTINIGDNVTILPNYIFSGITHAFSVTIPASVTNIGANAFRSSTGLTSVTLNEGLERISQYAFQGCNNASFTSIDFPSTLTFIDNNAFENCSKLTSVTIPASVTTLNGSAFKGCTSITSLTLNEGLVTIGANAFNGCSKIASALIIPESVTSIGNNAFYGCSKITSVEIRSNITTIPDAAFQGCSSITSVTLPHSVTTIGESAFKSCSNSSFTSIVIPASVTTINNNAFSYCSNLANVYMLSTTAPTLSDKNAFQKNYSAPYTYPTIHVMKGYATAYSGETNWSDLTIEEYTALTIANLDLTNSVTPLTIPSGVTITVTGTATNPTAANLVIEDGAQIILPEDASVNATVKRSVTGSSKGDAVWEAFASTINNPAIGSTNLITGTYDLYMYKESADYEWINYKAHTSDFANLTNSRGYLYRNAATMDITIEGALNTSDISDYTLSRSGSDPSIIGFNFVGNPYQMDIYKGVAISNTYLETGYYVLVDGAWSVRNDDVAIAPGTGILVQAKDGGNGKNLNVTYTNASSKANHDNIMFTVENSECSDITYAMFDKGHGLNKISHRNANVPMLYIPQNDENFAIAMMNDDTKAFDLNFKAMTTGKYTLSCKTKGNYSYLHVIDRLTGEDVDMLLEGEYSFIASKQDNENRFIVRLEYSENPEGSENSTFAWQNGSDIIVNGEGELQIFDVMGRRVSTVRVSGETTITAPSMHGVYIFKLNDKTQKIVVK